MATFRNDWRRIVGLGSEPVLRNLLITQGYHELSRDFARMLGPENVTWFSFASWSSKTVGAFLQNEQLPRVLRSVLDDVRWSREREPVLAASIRRMRSYLSLGNTEVFGELAPAFGRFLETFEGDREPDPQKLASFLETLEPGPSEPDRVRRNASTRDLEFVARGGQTLLREAMRHYYSAKFEPDAKRKAEHVLLANAHIGVHEQTRLQTYISGALDLPLHARYASDTRAIALAFGHRWLSGQARTIFRRFATERLLLLKLPDSSLRLGQDVRAAPGHPLVPRLLEHIEHPELYSMFLRYKPLPAAARPQLVRPRVRPASVRVVASHGTGADDWTSLHQRMRFILALFRSRQQNQRLLEPTFNDTQVAMLARGAVPVGPLI